MKDIPIFQSQHGVASLILRQIPYRQEAYVRFQAVERLEPLVKDCVSFCRACGAERIFGAEVEGLEHYPMETEIWVMERQRSALPQTQAVLQPVQDLDRAAWQEIYNRAMATVPHAALLPEWGQDRSPENCFFIHRFGERLGIGATERNTILAVAALQKGCGADLVAALASSISAPTVRLEVASANQRAVRLYQRLGFAQTKLLDRWYELGAEVSRKNT